MKTYGYLIAIESDKPLEKDEVEEALAMWLDHDNNYKKYKTDLIEAEALGEIECYEEDKNEAG